MGVIHLSDKSQSGFIRISDDVISIIAGLAALDTPGIASMSGGISEGLTKRLSGKNAKKGVFVEVMESEAAIHLRVIVNYGTKIKDVCLDLQENVREAVENLTGLRVVEVNVKVESLAVKEEELEATHRMK
jgi:uncharacterized alkaline shock family protein YloU